MEMATQRFKFQRSSSSQSIPPLAKRVPTYRNRRRRIFADYNSHQLFSVRVVEVPGVSMKLCGGTHVRNTFEICGFKIISEQGIASGIRRIEAVTGDAFIKYVSARDNYMKQLCSTLKDASFVPYNNFNPLMAEGMNGPEATHKLNPLDEKANVNSAIYPMVTNFEWRSDISQHSTVSTPNSLGPAFLRPSEKPNLLGAPSRRDVSLSESDPDVKKRIHMMNHKQDLRYRDSGDPPLLSRFPGQQSVLGIQPVGGRLAEEDTKKRRFGNQPSEIIRGSDLSKPDRPRAQQNSIVNSASSSLAVDYSSHLPKSEEAYHGHEVQKQNLPSTTHTSDFGNSLSLNGREIRSEGMKQNLPPPSIYIEVLQEIGERCNSKVEFRPVLSTSENLQFSVEVLFTGEKIGVGMGKTRKDAQQQAAGNALRNLADKYISHVAPSSGAVDRSSNKLSNGVERGFLWDTISPESEQLVNGASLTKESTSEV